MRPILLLSFLLPSLVACGPGGIRTDEVDGLRGVSSALWIEWVRDVQGADEVSHEFVLSSHGGLCKDLQEIVPAMADAYDDFAGEVEVDPDAYCNALENLYKDLGEIAEPMFKRELSTLSLTLRDPDDDPDDPPPEEIYDQGVDPDDPWFVGTLAHYDRNVYNELADAVGDCSNLQDNLEDAADDSVRWWVVDRGDVEAKERGSDAYHLSLEGELEEPDGDNAGDISAGGTFKHCVVEWQGWFEPLSFEL